METNFLYKVIWIDDDCKKYEEFMINAATEGIEIKAYEFGKDGIEALKNNIETWDGVILDVKCLYDEKDKLAKADNFYKVRDELMAIKNQKRNDIPYFVYSAQPDLIGNEIFMASLSGKKLYQKGKDQDDLLRDIKEAAANLPETQIRSRYLGGITFPEIQSELIKILKPIENNETSNADVIMECRQVLSWIMNYLHESVGVLQKEFNGSNLSECSMFLGHPKMRKYVPLYIQRSLHSCVDVSNNGSHLGEVRSAIQSGEAPFLIRSTVFELLNILRWCAKLSKDQKQVEKIKSDVSSLNISMKFVAEGALEKDKHGNFHCGGYLVTDNQVESGKLQVGDIIRIGKIQENSLKGESKPYKNMVVDGTIEKI